MHGISVQSAFSWCVVPGTGLECTTKSTKKISITGQLRTTRPTCAVLQNIHLYQEVSLLWHKELLCTSMDDTTAILHRFLIADMISGFSAHVSRHSKSHTIPRCTDELWATKIENDWPSKCCQNWKTNNFELSCPVFFEFFGPDLKGIYVHNSFLFCKKIFYLHSNFQNERKMQKEATQQKQGIHTNHDTHQPLIANTTAAKLIIIKLRHSLWKVRPPYTFWASCSESCVWFFLFGTLITAKHTAIRPNLFYLVGHLHTLMTKPAKKIAYINLCPHNNQK